jgi:hypothetical protein
MKDMSSMHNVMCIGRRVRACKRLSGAAKTLTTRDHVRGISGPSTLFKTIQREDDYPDIDQHPVQFALGGPSVPEEACWHDEHSRQHIRDAELGHSRRGELYSSRSCKVVFWRFAGLL